MFLIDFDIVCLICYLSNYRLQRCSLSLNSIAPLTSALEGSKTSHLKELDLRNNPDLWDSGLDWLSNTWGRLKTLR